MLYGSLYEEGFIKDILNSYHNHMLPKRQYFLMKKGQLPTCNLIEKTVSNVWKWCNNYMILVNYTSVLYDAIKLISEGLLYELVSNTAFLFWQNIDIIYKFHRALVQYWYPFILSVEFSRAIRKNTNMTLGLYHSLYEWFHPFYIKDVANNF